jgi:outer membrane protein TolC
MPYDRKTLALLLAASLLAPSGCNWQRHNAFESDIPDGTYEKVASEIEYPAESDSTRDNADESVNSPQPWTISTQGAPEYWDISLEQVIQMALANSPVLRDLGGAVVRAPDTVETTWNPAIVETNPQFGMEAALSEFDARFLASSYWQKNDRALNNEFFGGGTRLLQQDAGVYQFALTKLAATGSRFTIRHNVDYDANNAPGNFFPSAWNTNIETEFRHPLLQGSGVEFNRIAGPSGVPGKYNGVLIARLRTDVALSNFEIAVRDFVSNVENAYWDLYYGYRVLDARVRSRDAALETWRKIYALNQANRRGGEAEKEAQAREQFFRFQQDVQNALGGEPYESTRNWNGLPSGAFRTTGGVLMNERRLRLLMGLPPTDARLMRPADEPVLAKIDFDWEQSTKDAIHRRVELRRQEWHIRRLELELIAARNFLLPRLDTVGRYRWRGFGHDLIDPNGGELPRFDNAYEDLTTGDFQEWQLGLELTMPIGFRQAHTAERNAELLLATGRAILRDQQREVVHELADAVAELDRTYAVLHTSHNRLVAGRDQLGAVQAAYEADKAPLDLLLEAQRRVAEADVDYSLSKTRYAVAMKNVHFVKGTLLDYDGVYLSEGAWPGGAYCDAAERESRRGRPKPLNYASSRTPMVSRGVYPQLETRPEAVETDVRAVRVEPLPLEQPAAPLRLPESSLPRSALALPRE